METKQPSREGLGLAMPVGRAQSRGLLGTGALNREGNRVVMAEGPWTRMRIGSLE